MAATSFPSQPALPLRVVILTCGSLGIEIADALAADSRVQVVAVVKAPWKTKQLTLRGKFRHVIRTQGVRGLFHVLGARLNPNSAVSEAHPVVDTSTVSQIAVSDFHAADALSAIAGLDADLGILAGTYILRDTVFDIPRYGSINLHSGKAPEYRGAAPAFWELYNGENEVGITIHRVSSELDAGHVLLQKLFPLDAKPAGDPIAYIERFRGEVLRPNGVRLMAEVVGQIASGTAAPVVQDGRTAHTYRSPDFKAIRELRKRVRMRRGNQ